MIFITALLSLMLAPVVLSAMYRALVGVYICLRLTAIPAQFRGDMLRKSITFTTFNAVAFGGISYVLVMMWGSL